MKILYPFSLIYGALSAIDRKTTAEHTLPKPVISIGNITWGGTGKTPVVIKLTSEIFACGLKPCILSRGYFRKDKKHSFIAVSDGKRILVPPEMSGDEPNLIAQSVPGAVVMAGRNRLKSAEYALGKFSPDVFILDDGFQHWKISRGLDIVCVNALNPFGNGLLIPAGILREPVSALKRAGLVIITSSDLVSEHALKAVETRIKRNFEGKLLRARYAPKSIKRIFDGQTFALDELKSGPFTAFSAIGENSGFKKLLEKSGINVASQLDFRDHHWYNLEEIRSIGKGRSVITTTKDAVRLKSLLEHLPVKEAENFYALEIELVFINGDGIWEKGMEKKLRPSSTATARL